MKAIILALGSAVFYVLATYAMKHWSNHVTLTAVAVIALALAGAVVCEIFALRIERLGYLYIAILGFECVIIAVVAIIVEGEVYATKELVGIASIVAGVALLSV